MADAIKPKNLTACPVCGARMELLSRQGGYVQAGCEPCHFSITVSQQMWLRAKSERDANAPPPEPPPAR